MTGLVPEAGVELNPDAVHPPFPWQVALPSSWSVLDTHPATWQRGRDRLIDERLAGQRLRSADRRAVANFVDDLVATCQRAGTLISMIQIGPLSGGGVASAGLHLAWYDSTPDLASLATVRQAIGRVGVIEEAETEAGTLLLQRDHLSLVPPGASNRVGMTSLQAFLPLVERCWTAVVATACAHPELEETALEDLVLAVAGSIRPLGQESGDLPEPNRIPPEVTYTPVETPKSVGIERGFGTLVVRRVEGAEPGPGDLA